jgi:hypothetical protein
VIGIWACADDAETSNAPHIAVAHRDAIVILFRLCARL